MQVKEMLKKMDWCLFLLMLALVSIGILAINSATAYSGNTEVVEKQIMFFCIGLVLMFFVMCIDYHVIGNWYMIIYVATIILLVAVMLVGTNVNGATRWIRIGPIQIQPSEFAKISMILCCGKVIEKYNKRINELWPVLIIGGYGFVLFILVNRQPNLSTSLVLLSILVIQLFVTKLNLKYIVTTVVVGVLVLIIAFVYIVNNPNQILLQDYQRNRIVNMINGGDSLSDSYQTDRAVHAIGSGGLTGKGLYNGSISQLNYLPESHNDFIMAVVGEEFGFIGALIVIGIILLFVIRGLWVASRAPDDLGRFIVVGYIGMIAMQAFVNIGVVTDLLPNTGVPIPFISYGGSALWANMIGMGLVLNVAMSKEETLF